MTKKKFYVNIEKRCRRIIIANLKGKIICLYKNIYENCYFKNNFIKVRRTNYLDKKIKNFNIPIVDNSFYYLILNENNLKNIDSLISEEILKMPTEDICQLFNYNNEFYYKYNFTNRKIVFDNNLFSQNESIKNIRPKKQNLIVIPKVLLKGYVSNFQEIFGINPNVLFEKDFNENNSNITLITYYKLPKLIENFDNYHFDNLNILEFQSIFSQSTLNNMFLKNSTIPIVFKNLLFISNKIKNFNAACFSFRNQEEVFILQELFDCDVILNYNMQFYTFKKPEKNYLLNEEILKIKNNLFDF